MKKSIKNIVMLLIIILMAIVIFLTIDKCLLKNENLYEVEMGYYVIFSISGFIVILTFLYLLMSQFNEYTFKETFDGTSKKVIYFIEVIVLTAGLIALQWYFFNKTTNKIPDKTPSSNSGIPITFEEEKTKPTKNNTIGEQATQKYNVIIGQNIESNVIDNNTNQIQTNNIANELLLNNVENNLNNSNTQLNENIQVNINEFSLTNQQINMNPNVIENQQVNDNQKNNTQLSNNYNEIKNQQTNSIANEQLNTIGNQIYDEDDDEYYDDYEEENNSNEQTSTEIDNRTEHQISLSDEKIMIDGLEIGKTGSIYVSNRMKNGTTDEEGKKKNKKISTIINITRAGTYEFSGSLSDGQIAINANEIEGYVNIILNNVNITCKNAPAIFIYDKDTKNEFSEISIFTSKGSYNTINGGELSEDVTQWKDKENILYYIEEGMNDSGERYQRYKYDGAISSDVSLTFGGEGTLDVTSSKNEGIESKMNLTFNGGIYIIKSMSDGINASADDKSIISIKDGEFYIRVSNEASQGDGIDSRGYVYINGGTVYTFAKPGIDNGIDSKLGTYINGGTVLSTGSVYDEYKTQRNNTIIQMQLKNEVKAGESLVIVDDNNQFVFAFKSDRNFSTFAYTSENIKQRNYSVYSGVNVSGKLDRNNVYLSIQSMDLNKMTKQGDFLMGGKYAGGKNGENENVILLTQSFMITSTILIAISVFALITIIIVDLNTKYYEDDNNNNMY